MASEPAIEAYLREAPYLHAYELGDLDPLEASHTMWLATPAVDAVALIYRGLATPTLVALAHGDPASLRALLAERLAELPPRFYAHLTPGVENVLAARYRCDLLGHNRKMALVAPPDEPSDGSEHAAGVVRLGPEHADEALRFYAISYPDGYFDPRNLSRGPHVAVRDARGLAAVAGVHVYSPAKRVAALGNIATRPDARGRGHAGRATAALCRLLRREVDIIGLNVRADNAAAIACYQRVGFELRDAYDEWRMTQR